MRIEISQAYEHLREFIESIPAIFDVQGEMLHDGRNVIKVFRTACGLQLNVKRYHIPSGPNLLIYSSGLRKPKGRRAYEYPQHLLACGIETPEAVAYIEERRCGLLGYSYFVSIQCPYGHTMYELGNAKAGDYGRLAADFARFTARLHESGIMHLDYSPGNILFDSTPDGEYRFSLVDINRMRFGHVSMRRGLANLTRLWGPKQLFMDIVSAYARARGFDEGESLKIALDGRRRFWTHYQRKHNVDFPLEL